MQKYIVTRSSAQIRSHAQKFFNQIKRKGGQVLIRDNKQRQSRMKKRAPAADDANFEAPFVRLNQSCIVAQSSLQDDSKFLQVGNSFCVEQKNRIGGGSATSLDGRE